MLHVEMMKPFHTEIKDNKIRLVFAYQYFSLRKDDEVFSFIPVEGKEIVQLYVKDLETSVQRPLKELKDFQKIHLNPGSFKTVYFTLKPRDFSFWDETTSSWKIEPGKFEIMIGSSSADIKLKKAVIME